MSSVIKQNSSKQAAIDAIARCFRRRGYNGTSMSDLSEATGLGRSSLYHHFPGGKEEMALAALEVAEELLKGPIAGAIKSAMPGQPRIEFASILRNYYEDGRLGCLLAMIGMQDCPPESRRKIAELTNFWIDTLATFFGGNADAYVLARREIALLQGALMISIATEDTTAFEAALAEVERG